MKHILDYNLNEDLQSDHGGGDCFDSSWNYINKNGFKNRGLRLVHGIVSGQGPLSGYRFAHGWCEDSENVYDNARGKERTIPKILYYAIGNIDTKECFYYDYPQTMKMGEEYGDKGPWEMENTHYPESWNKKRKK